VYNYLVYKYIITWAFLKLSTILITLISYCTKYFFYGFW